MAIPTKLRNEVLLRADNRCEYCTLTQAGQEATFHVDHVIPVSDNGPTEAQNLALAYVSCSLRKGARQFVADPRTGENCRLFNPRRDRWNDHFTWEGSTILGLTPIGRSTVAALDLNRPIVLAIRDEEAHWGRHPPKT